MTRCPLHTQESEPFLSCPNAMASSTSPSEVVSSRRDSSVHPSDDECVKRKLSVEVDFVDRLYEKLERWTPSGELNAIICFLLVLVFSYFIYLSMFAKPILDPFAISDTKSSVDYSTTVLAVLIVLFLAIIFGYICSLVHLPSLLGMLVAGIVLGNLPWTSEIVKVNNDWSFIIRRLAFMIILIKGGLALDAAALMKLKLLCAKISFIPCLVEATVVAVLGRLLFGMNMMFGFMMGFVVGNVSPAVVVPAMADAQSQGYGTRMGIPSLVIASANVDNVLAITLFNLLLSSVFSQDASSAYSIIKAPIEVLVGVIIGLIAGVFFWLFPSRDQSNFHFVRFTLFMIFNAALLFCSQSLNSPSVGAIGILVTVFVAALSWKKKGEVREIGYLNVSWHLFFQPLLFGLIGLELSFKTMTLKLLLISIAIVVAGVAVRVVATYLTMLREPFSFKERLLICLAWMPKATIQAALAPIVLSTVRLNPSAYPSDYADFGSDILVVGVMSILLTAPIGAFLLKLLIPRLLTLPSIKPGETRTGLVTLSR